MTKLELLALQGLAERFNVRSNEPKHTSMSDDCYHARKDAWSTAEQEIRDFLNKFGEAYDEDDHACADGDEDGLYFAHVTFEGVSYIDTDNHGWVPTQPGYRDPTAYVIESEAQAAADEFLAKKKSE